MKIAMLVFLVTSSILSGTFKLQQKQFPRVREAYLEKEEKITELFSKHSLQANQLEIYLRAFKSESVLEIWAKNKTDQQYQLIRSIEICQKSGNSGPKRKEGDRQVPEGFYHINRFNPNSKFHLSLGINYPNQSDRILSNKNKPGGDIFIHGACKTIGCLPITDNYIKELYVICVEAKNSGQKTIPVTIFPTRLTQSNFNDLKFMYKNNPELIGLWKDLKKGFDYFNENKKLPTVSFLESGRHSVY